jgi:hypothetical protein
VKSKENLPTEYRRKGEEYEEKKKKYASDDSIAVLNLGAHIFFPENTFRNEQVST